MIMGVVGRRVWRTRAVLRPRTPAPITMMGVGEGIFVESGWLSVESI